MVKQTTLGPNIYLARPITMTKMFLLLTLLMTTTLTAQDSRPIVIVHGAWGGAHHWKAVGDALTTDHQREVHRASLTGLGERSHLANRDINADTHIRDVVNLIEFEDLQSVILIGHSYGGVVISGVAEAIPERISQLIYLDSYVLNDGECFFTQDPEHQKKLTARAVEAGDGWLIPVDWPNTMRDTPHPLATMIQPIKLVNPAREKIPSSYWLFTDGADPNADNRYIYYQRAKQRGWTVKTFSWNHNAQREQPADLVLELVQAFEKK